LDLNKVLACSASVVMGDGFIHTSTFFQMEAVVVEEGAFAEGARDRRPVNISARSGKN
jgi:hypothetical protein